MPTVEHLLNLAKTVRCLRAAQRAYMAFRENYPQFHAVREQAGELVERCAREVDNALILVDE
jgi:ribosomal protein S2